jgi:hypothetical protein
MNQDKEQNSEKQKHRKGDTDLYHPPGKALSVEEFFSATSHLAQLDESTLFVIDIRGSRLRDGILIASTPACQSWFDIPVAAIKTITPIALACDNNPTQLLVSIIFREEFRSLVSTFRALGSKESDRRVIGYYGPHRIPPELLENGRSLGIFQERRPEPCPITTDAFLGEPGKFSNIDVAPPPRGTFVKLRYDARNIGITRVLIKQAGTVVGRFYGDLQDTRGESVFYSNGGDIEFEIQECVEYTDGTHAWVPLQNFVHDDSSGANHNVLLRTSNGATACAVLWGPGIMPPPPPVYLHPGGQLRCGGWGWRVATSYAFAWTTSTPDPNGPRIAVPKLSVAMHIGCRDFKTGHSAQNVSDVVASEQFRGINVPVCCEFYVTAEAILQDGSRRTASTTIKEP